MEMPYSNSCFRDANGELCGYLYLSENCYIDFMAESIVVDGKSNNVKPQSFRLLRYFVLNHDTVIEYESIFERMPEFVVETNSNSDNSYSENQKIRNALDDIKKILKSADIDIKSVISTKKNIGYIFKIPYKILHITSVEKSDITSIDDVFSVIDSNGVGGNVSDRITDFSKKFLYRGATALINSDGDTIKKALCDLSSVFSDISNLKMYDENVSFENIGIDLYDIIVREFTLSDEKNILKIKGPLGSYKNRLMQYIFLLILKKERHIMPIYIDISAYENSDDESVVLDAVNDDFDEIENMISSFKTKAPLIFISGVRDFYCASDAIYSQISKRLSGMDCRIVECIDTDFTMNQSNKSKYNKLSSSNFKYFLRIKSMSLYRKEKSISFISECIRLFGVKLTNEMSAQSIYDALVKLNFISIDAYWLVNLLNTQAYNVDFDNIDIAELYEIICSDIVGNKRIIDQAAELAYKFEFSSVESSDISFFRSTAWKLVKSHRSVLEYLISRHYVSRLSKIDFSDSENAVKELKFFNMVLQKSLTRFIVPMIKGVDNYEHKILIIAEQYYDSLSVFGKSELTFWLGRLKSPVRKQKAVELLKSYKEKAMSDYYCEDCLTQREKRELAFLIRGISISLIYEGDRESLEEYMNCILKDKTANSVNRGFHLEYYGDKPYIPNQALLDFEDDVSSGESTLGVLSLSLDGIMQGSDYVLGDDSTYGLSFSDAVERTGLPSVAVIETVTICSLLQARLEKQGENNVMDIAPYIPKTKAYLRWILTYREIKELENVCGYLKWMLRQLEGFSDDNVKYHHSAVYNKHSSANEIKRTGWLRYNIESSENIVEHMYNCWLMGMIYLPDKSSQADYDKRQILDMLLIHDLGEIETGDIIRPEKRLREEYYDQKENEAMQSFLFESTYPLSGDYISYLDVWNKWNNKDGINYLIAKDIDNIQAVYRFFKYYCLSKGSIPSSEISYWITSLSEIKTDIGRDIAKILIYSNPDFSKIFEQ